MVLLYLTAIVLANLTISVFGPKATVVVAFLFIGLDITARDYLHEKWKNNLWMKMLALIFVGSALTFLLNKDSLNIAIASFTAFALAGLADFIAYHLLRNKSRFKKINGSNAVSSAVDSIVFRQ